MIFLSIIKISQMFKIFYLVFSINFLSLFTFYYQIFKIIAFLANIPIFHYFLFIILYFIILFLIHIYFVKFINLRNDILFFICFFPPMYHLVNSLIIMYIYNLYSSHFIIITHLMITMIICYYIR